jgi:hypothetical protein
LPFQSSYTDEYLSLVPGTPAYFGNRSIVVHYANKTRITCANFTTISTGYETPITPPGYASATATGTGLPSNSANLSTVSARTTAGTPTTVRGPSATSNAPSSTSGTGAANPAYWVSSGAVLGAMFAMVL